MKLFARFTEAVIRHPRSILIFFVLISVPAGHWASLLFGDLRANLRELLPQNAPAVVTLRQLEKRFGGFSDLSIVASSPDRAANRRFSDDLVRELSGDIKVRSIRNNYGAERRFFEGKLGLFLEKSDLETVKERIEDAIHEAKARANPLLVDLEDEEPTKLDLSDLEQKYRSRAGPFVRFPDDYFESPDGQLVVTVIQQRGFSFTISKNIELVNAVQAAIARLKPETYHPEMRIGLGGDVKNLIEEKDTLVEDLVLASVVVAILLIGAVLIFFRRVQALPLLAAPVLFGSVLTFAAGHFLVGHLNASSAFLGSIIAGNGINFGIVLLARYMEERRAGARPEDGVRAAMHETFEGTGTAALAAAVAYGSLMATDFLGFKHFGMIGGLGMLLCWVVTFLVLPSSILLIERVWPMNPETELRLVRPGLFSGTYARFVTRAPRMVTVSSIVLITGSLVATLLFLRDPFERDFRKLRSTMTDEEGSAYWNKKVDFVFGRYLSPQIVLADDPADVPPILAHLRSIIEREGEETPISDVVALSDFVPRDQEEKVKLLLEIRRLLTDDVIANLEPEQKKTAERLRPPADLKPFGVEDLPESIRGDFRELNGAEGLAVLVFPNIKRNLWYADEIRRVGEVLRAVPLPNGKIVASSGNFVIYSDMLDAVAYDGPRATLYSFLGVVLLCLIVFRRPERAALVIAALLAGIALLGLAFFLFEMRINFLNFISLPIAFGIGVDYAVNVYSRYRQEKDARGRTEAVKIAVMSTGGAVTLCSWTTVIGYASLLVARNGALISFGRVAITAEISTMLAALLFMPAWLLVRRER